MDCVWISMDFDSVYHLDLILNSIIKHLLIVVKNYYKVSIDMGCVE